MSDTIVTPQLLKAQLIPSVILDPELILLDMYVFGAHKLHSIDTISISRPIRSPDSKPTIRESYNNYNSASTSVHDRYMIVSIRTVKIIMISANKAAMLIEQESQD